MQLDHTKPLARPDFGEDTEKCFCLRMTFIVFIFACR